MRQTSKNVTTLLASPYFQMQFFRLCLSLKSRQSYVFVSKIEISTRSIGEFAKICFLRQIKARVVPRFLSISEEIIPKLTYPKYQVGNSESRLQHCRKQTRQIHRKDSQNSIHKIHHE